MALSLTILAYGLQWGLETGFLLLALWFMARIQKLQYTVPGLLLCAAIACLFDMIPYVGHYIALAALWVSLTKVTREDFTGVVFTAAISYALVFGMNLFLLGALMGDLRPSARARTLSTRTEQKAAVIESDDEESDSSSATLSEGNEPATTPATAPPGKAAGEPTKAALTAQAKPAQAASPSSDLPPSGVFVLKGITQNGKSSMALVSAAGKTYTLFLNETVRVQTSAGTKSVRLDKVEKSCVVLDVEGQLVTVKDAPPQ